MLRRALAAAGLRAVNLYSLRHTFASTLIMQGAAVSEAAHLLGHSSPAVTLKVYTHWFKNKTTDSTTRLAAAILGPSNGADGSKVVAADPSGGDQEAVSA